jgi:hypothetical protein
MILLKSGARGNRWLKLRFTRLRCELFVRLKLCLVEPVEVVAAVVEAWHPIRYDRQKFGKLYFGSALCRGSVPTRTSTSSHQPLNLIYNRLTWQRPNAYPKVYFDCSSLHVKILASGCTPYASSGIECTKIEQPAISDASCAAF